MDVRRLMYGDWVHCITDNDNYKFGRITHNPECHCNIDDKLNFNYDIEPIPITIDFLKKNGFKQDEGVEAEEYILYGDWGRMFYVPEWKGFYVMRGDGIVNFYAVVEYVHEIQHMMRMAKLDNIADNLEI